MKCTKTASVKISLGGQPCKYACEKHLKHVQGFAKIFKTKLEVTALTPEEKSKCCDQDI